MPKRHRLYASATQQLRLPNGSIAKGTKVTADGIKDLKKTLTKVEIDD
jgi:hypothetical protein